MLARLDSSGIFGLDAFKVEVEVFLTKSLPSFHIVGLPDKAVNESKERVRAGISSSEFHFPLERITVNLAPADLKKEGPAYDLPIALCILLATKQLNIDNLEKYMFVGELSLNGDIKRLKGALSMAINCKNEGKEYLIIPKENAIEAAMISEIKVIPVENLNQVVDFLSNKIDIKSVNIDRKSLLKRIPNDDIDFRDVRGQFQVKRALEIAVAGGHNVILTGPPGAGKSMLARRIPTIISEMTFDEIMEVTKIYSISGLLSSNSHLMKNRPFRSPHHTITDIGLIGGGNYPKPGEISLAHNGVLFLDEIPQFGRSALESLRQPMEDGKVIISRNKASFTYPSKFMLIASANPCPCGFLGDSFNKCRCSYYQISNYKKRLSGPLLDRIDIHVFVPRLSKEDLTGDSDNESSADIRKRVQKARAVQRKRFLKDAISCNAYMNTKHVSKYCKLNEDAKRLLEMAIEKMGISGRGYYRILKVSRTIADLDKSEDIKINHISEAIQYRVSDKKYF
ncbi:MAG: YifB family Mg chelatase-like AAA ATPase [Actinobacteria bacterium]|nr:YifB family Mg chelatase-like AAA ATPase [Actinomycetota bacterium]